MNTLPRVRLVKYSLLLTYVTSLTGAPFSEFMAQALEVSSIAPAMKTLYEAIKASSIAYITIHDLPLELQLPPYLDSLLHTEGELEMDISNDPDDEMDEMAWGTDMNFGWRLPALSPWKSLLLLDSLKGTDPYMNLRGPHITTEDTTLAEGLVKLLETASVTLS
jgi:nitrogen permease regulator 3-like protein